MAFSSDWSFLKRWCLALGPYLSVKACGSDARARDRLVVQVAEFLGPRGRDTPLNATTARLALLYEALDLLSLALHSNCNRQVVLELCENADVTAQVKNLSKEDWKPRFQLAFTASPHGDSHDALTILKDFMTRNQRSDDYQAARTRIMRDWNVSRGYNLRLSIALQPALKDTSNFRTSYLSAPSRADTIRYYDALYAALKALSASDALDRASVDSLELDLVNLETPADAMSRIRDIVALGMPIGKLGLHLGYSWDAFDQAKLVSVLNSTPTLRIDHLVIAASTCDNLEAALISLPNIETARHVELLDHVLFGHPASSFTNAFRRISSARKKWQPTKLTLRGTQFEASNVKSLNRASSFGVGLQELAVYLPASEVDAFVRVLPQFGPDLRSLELEVTHERRSRELLLDSIAQACPQLRRLELQGVSIGDLGVVPELFEREGAKWSSLVLRDVSTTEAPSLTVFSQALADPATKLANRLLAFTFGQASTLSAKDVECMHLALKHNKRLEYLALGPLEEIAKTQLAQFDQEPLCERKFAFLSVVYRSTNGTQSPQSALASVDSWNLAHIMNLAGLTRHRRIILS